MIGIVANSPSFGLNASQQVANKWKSISLALVGHTQKLDDVVDVNFPNDLDYASIFSKVIVQKLSNGSIDDLYLHCSMNFAANTIQTQTPQFMDVVFSTINSLDKKSVISTPATRIQRPTDGSHWSMPDHVFGKATAVGISEAKSYHDYNCKISLKFVNRTRYLSARIF